MAQYDGSIRILTEISTNAAQKSIGTLSNMITLTAKEISSLRSKMNALKGQKFYTDDYKELQSKLTKAEKNLSVLIKKQTAWKNTKVVGTSLWENLNKEIDMASSNVDSIKNKIQALENEGKAFTFGSDTAEYVNYERQLQYEQAALAEATKQYQAMDKLKDPYGRLSQSVSGLNEKIIKILSPIHKVRSAFSQDVNVSGYERLQSSLGELGGIALRAAETIKDAFATLKQGPVAVIHNLSSSLVNMANRVNSAMGSMLGDGLEKFGEGIGAIAEKARQMASSVSSAIKSAASVALEKLAGLAGSALNIVLHPFQTLKNVASTTLNGIANIVKGALGSALEGLKSRAAGLAASLINGLVHPFQTLKSIASGTINGVNKLLSGMVSIAKRAGKAISFMASILKRATSSMLGFGKSTKKSNNALQSGLKNILKYGLGIRSLYALVNKLRTAIKEGFSNMANEVDGFKTKVDSLKASTLTLKNSFAAAFRPLVEIAIPYIQMVVDAMSNLLDMVGQFIAAISGQKTYTKAIKQTTAAIEDENKAQNKQLSGLDKLNNLSSGSKGSADSGSSTQMFEEHVPISDKFADMAQWFKDMWSDADFSEIGAAIGEKLKTALENIPWDSIQQTVARVGASFATLINGIVEVPRLALDVGKTIGEAINTGIGGINSFLDNTNWNSVGEFIGNGANGIVESINWQEIGHFFASKFNTIFETIGEAARTFDWGNFGLELSNGFNTFISDFDWAENGERLGDSIKGILDTIITFLENTDWQELGNRVADFVGSIDWSGIASRIFEGIGAALGGLAAFLWGLIEDGWSSVVEWWKETAFEDGKFTIKGLLNGIWEVLKSIDTWLKENVFDPIINGFKNAFGIHSPSTVMLEIGKFLMEGLFNGISSFVDKVISLFTKIKENVVGVWDALKSKTAEIWNEIKNAIKTPINAILGFVESFVNGIINGINFAVKALNNLSFDVPEWVPGIGGEKLGFNIPELSNVSIPRLATGAVIPANREFLAVLGDQKHGTNIEAPLDTIKRANEEAILNVFSKLGISGGNSKSSNNETFVFQVDGRTFFEIMRSEAEQYFSRTGMAPFPI